MSRTKGYIDSSGKRRDLNERQRKFCEIYVYGVKQASGEVKHPALCDCYTLAGYDTAGYSRKNLQAKASHLLAKEHIQAYINELREVLESETRKAAVWDRGQLLRELRLIFEDAVSASKGEVRNDLGEVTGASYNAKAAGVALKATQQVAQMLGYNEPEKVENKFVVEFSKPEASSWTK